MVKKYLGYVPNKNYEVFKSLVDLDLKKTQHHVNNGTVVAIIQYTTLYFIDNTTPPFLLFRLGNDTSSHSVLNIPRLLIIGSVVDLVTVELVCSELFNTFLP